MLPIEQLEAIKAVLEDLDEKNLIIRGLSKDRSQVHTISFMLEELHTKLSGCCIIEPERGVKIAAS